MAGYAMGSCATIQWTIGSGTSLPRALARRLLIAAAAVSGLIAAGFALAGAWPVLPFAGIEVAALWAAIHHLRRHAGDHEKIVRDETRLVVERQFGSRHESFELNPYWARLRLETPPGGGEERMFVGSHGREVEIGRGLDGSKKRALALQIRKALAL